MHVRLRRCPFGVARLRRLRMLLATRRGSVPRPTRSCHQGPGTVLSPTLELSAYRVIQEALTNTRKHSDATDGRERRKARQIRTGVSPQDIQPVLLGVSRSRARDRVHDPEVVAGRDDESGRSRRKSGRDRGRRASRLRVAGHRRTRGQPMQRGRREDECTHDRDSPGGQHPARVRRGRAGQPLREPGLRGRGNRG